MVGIELLTGGLAALRETAARAEPDMTVSRLAVRASNNEMRLIVYLSLGAGWSACATAARRDSNRPARKRTMLPVHASMDRLESIGCRTVRRQRATKGVRDAPIAGPRRRWSRHGRGLRHVGSAG